MKAKTLIVALATLAAAGASMAGDYLPFPPQEGGQAARAQVQADARHAVAAGDVVVGEAPLVDLRGAARVDRAAVRAEVARANAGGALPTGELLSFERRALRHRAG